MNNFEFLKSIDKNLYEIISDAEKLYCDEYFEQCIGQTRRFAENVCKNTLGAMRTTEKTFDDMLATLKDKSCNEEQEKEFIDDLYFLKREGNASVHANTVKKDGIVALECLQRAFEVAINYALYRSTSSKKADLLKLRYDTELLITGKRKTLSLKEKYAEEKARENRITKNKKTTQKTSKKTLQQSHKIKPKDYSKKSFSVFKLFLKLSALISIILVLTIYLLSIV